MSDNFEIHFLNPDIHYETSGILIYRIENGKIVEHREEIDSLGQMMQLGMELKPKEEK